MFFHRSALHHRSGVRIHRQSAAASSADGDGRGRPRVAQKSHPWAPPSIPFRRRQRVAVSLARKDGRTRPRVAQKSHPWARPSIPFQRRQRAAVSSATRHATRQMVGCMPMRIALVLVRSFLMGNAVPTHPTTLKPHAGGMVSEACYCPAPPTGSLPIAYFPKPCPPLFGESGCMHSTRACTFFVRCRPLLGGVRWAARGGGDMCHAVWCMPVRMGIVLARSFSIAHAAPTHQTSMRRALARTQGVP
jgi:hypothetical protein